MTGGEGIGYPPPPMDAPKSEAQPPADERPIALVSMPWQALDAPSLQVGLLKVLLEREGLPTRSHSLHLGFMDFLAASFGDEKQPFTPDDYRFIADRWAELAVGDWVFATEAVRAADAKRDRAYAELIQQRGMPKDLLKRLQRLRQRVPAFLAAAAEEVLAAEPSAVGFTLTFTQTFASLALAHELKRRRPELPVVIGGAACAAPMGRALLEAFPWVDAAVSGEAEAVAAELFRALRDGEGVPELPGVARRAGAEALAAPAEGRRSEMDAVPSPDYDEFFARLARSPLQVALTPRVPFESARGCWWGEKAHCTFCGLNAMDMAFRSKSPERTLEEIVGLSTRYRVLDFTAVDNIIDRDYLRSVLPALAELGLDLKIFYEAKANLSREEVRTLRRAGIRKLQPGIESLSTHTLKLMKKGVTGLQNVRVLKWCAADGIEVAWNLLYGFPGELPEEYEAMAELVPSLVHLPPPALGPIVIDRFSPYHEHPEEHGIELTGPAVQYPLLYDAPEPVLSELAYTFQHRLKDGRDPRGYVVGLSNRLRRWHKEFPQNAGALTYRRGPGFLHVDDRRTTTENGRYELEGLEAAVHDAIDDGASVQIVRERVAATLGAKPDEAEVRRILGEFVEARIAMEERGRFLSLALPLEGVEAPTIVQPGR